MANVSYLVVRLHPESPVDSATFGTYLDGLSIKIYKADAPQTAANLLGQVPTSSSPFGYTPIQLIEIPFAPGTYVAGVSKLLLDATKPIAPNNFGKTLTLASTGGIPFGSTVVSPEDSSLVSGGTTVTDLNADETTVTLSQNLPKNLPAATVLTFYYQYGPLTLAADFSSFSFQVKTSGSTSNNKTVAMASTGGVAPGMTVTGAGVPGQTVVTAVSSSSVTLSNAVSLGSGVDLTFTAALNAGIEQHVEPTIAFDGFNPYYYPVLKSVATAVILIPNQPAGAYVDIAVVAARTIQSGQTIQIPIDTEFYNVLVSVDSQLPSPGTYQSIQPQQTSLYIGLPPPPTNDGALSLLLPSDGTAPQFDQLLPLIQQASQFDSYFVGVDLTALTTDQCARMAYDIVWSQQNPLPLPHHSLEDLYTNPPNTGASSDSGSNGGEQDRQRFEGTLSSFYSTRNSTAVRLTKFVAAASCALYCEAKSTKSPQALLEFIVDPSAFGDASPVESAVLLAGLDANTNFGVPAAFFYALGSNQGQMTPADSRYKSAVGDTVDRLLQEFGQAVMTHVINDLEGFSLPLGSPPAGKISSAQAARRLVALAIASNTTTPVVQLTATPAFANLVAAWLAATPVLTGPNARPTYQAYQSNSDAIIWALLAGVSVPPSTAQDYAVTTQPDESGYLYLVLSAISRGFVNGGVSLASKILAWLPSTTAPATANPTIATLKSVSAAQWTAFFTTGPADPSWLPPFTQPGNNLAPSQSPLQQGFVSIQIKAFIRAVQRFFSVSSVPNQAPPLNPTAPATYNTPGFDAIGQAAAALGSGFAFGAGPLTSAQIAAAVQGIFPPGDGVEAQRWLTRAIATINDLAQIAKVVPEITPNAQPTPGDLRFSIMEALYARGFTSAKDITQIDADEFQLRLTGTVAYAYAQAAGQSLYQAAQAIAPQSPSAGGGSQTFTPINPDGSLTDCIPPYSISPFGPAAYLQEMLALHQDADCASYRQDASVDSTPTLGSALATRRGPVGNLLTTHANVATLLPLVDIVNECLENMAARAPAAAPGAVYDTATTTLDGYSLCEGEAEENGDCHPADELLAAVPQWSSPAAPVRQPTAYANLASDFSSCDLPYNQPLDVSRTYHQLLSLCRPETMRTFRKDITEFVLDPDSPPAEFADYLWRLPVKFEIALEYLCISQQAFDALYSGGGKLPENLPPWRLYGFASAQSGDKSWIATVSQLSEFLARTCLTYCEFIELQRVAPVAIRQRSPEPTGFPDCEPCCLDEIAIGFGGSDREPTAALIELALFIRLWRSLRHCRFGLSFAELADVCAVLGPLSGGVYTKDFIRQVAALQMLREHFGLPLVDGAAGAASGASGADRTHLLALWVGSTAAKWTWAVNQLLDAVQRTARKTHRGEERSPEYIKLLAGNLDSLSQLAGFDPAAETDTWRSRPTCTLRFAEVLAKICASNFSVGDLIFVTTANPQLDGEEPFPLQEKNEAQDFPLDLPEDQPEHSLHALRHKLLAAEVSDEDCADWTWDRISHSMQQDFGYTSDDTPATPDLWTSFGKHFFPDRLASSGIAVTQGDRRFTHGSPVSTPPLMWNVPANGPFRCDASSGSVTMWSIIPLRDEAVIEKLTRVRKLSADEQAAVQDLYFQPRALLAPFAFIFPDFASADAHLIQEPDEDKRWEYFTRHFALTHARCRLIAAHLAHSVAHAKGRKHDDDDVHTAWTIIRDLFADENAPVSPATWEDPSGEQPKLTWNPKPNGCGFAAILGLTGTGLLAEFSTLDDKLLWREMQGALRPFGDVRDRANAPVPTVLPQIGYAPPPSGASLVSLHNGFAIRDTDGVDLGGAQGYKAQWSGVLLVEHDGRYEFNIKVPQTEHGETASHEDRRAWKVVLGRGQKSWLLLKNRWEEAESEPAVALFLKRGAYQLTISLRSEAPDFTRPDWTRRQHAGLELGYRGPDTGDEWAAIPRERLFNAKKDVTLGHGVSTGDKAKTALTTFLNSLYASSLRDIRRTYQRALKALLMAKHFQLSSKPASDDGSSELGYMLANSALFAGAGFARKGSAFATNLVGFNFNFLPLRDDYFPPAAAQDARVDPEPARVAALFDQWERLFDYVSVRRQASSRRERPVWLLFDEAMKKKPTHVGFLLRHLGIDSRHFELLLNYYVGPMPGTLYTLGTSDLEDDRWMVRVWRGELWIRRLLECFCPKDLTAAQPALWAADDPGAPVGSLSVSGNQNLESFVWDGYFGGEKPWRYAQIRQADDGLRDRARRALIAYLCHGDRVGLPWSPGSFATRGLDLSDFLLLDVEAGLCEKASRIDEAVSAVQSFVRRARLGLEPTWPITRGFAELWDRRFATFRVWQACRRRELYRENWAGWHAIEQAQRVEAFRFLEAELKSSSLSVAEPGGGEWWPNQPFAPHDGLTPLQAAVSSTLQLLPVTPPPTPEGFTLLGTPENSGQPSWLAAMGQPASAPPTPPAPSERSTDATPQEKSAKAPIGALARSAAQAARTQDFPFWLEAAARLGAQFIRVAAAGEPAASSGLGGDNTDPHGCGESCCCPECGTVHPPLVDEYYFWLVETLQYVRPDQAFGIPVGTPPGTFQFGVQDAYYDQAQQQSVHWNNGDDPVVMAKLLNWPANPAVRLAWVRVHNGKFGPERRSTDSILVTAAVGLQFLGRAVDSLYFSIGGGSASTPPNGFRFDLPSNKAVALPLPAPAPVVSVNYPGQLTCYPYFVYDTPGAGLYPTSIFAPALAVAGALRARCRYDLALKWYEQVFAPLDGDCTWIECGSLDETRPTPSTPDSPPTAPSAPPAAAQSDGSDDAPSNVSVEGRPSDAGVSPQAGRQPGSSRRTTESQLDGGPCCDSTDVPPDKVRDRAILLDYCDTLLEWGWRLMKHRPCPESYQQARLLFDTAARILGRRPRRVLLPEPADPQNVSSFTPAIPPLNPRLLEIYDHTADRLRLIRECINASRLGDGRLREDMSYFGDNPERHGWQNAGDPCVDQSEWCLPPSPYRFTFLIQKSLELATQLRDFGNALLSAIEKRDAEILASLRAEHESELVEMQIAIRQNEWRNADWAIQSLQQQKDLHQTNLIYYSGLYQNDLINDEIQYQSLSTTAMQTRTAANMVEAGGEAMKVIPDLFLGFPCNDAQAPIGTKLAGVFETIGKVISIFADIQSSTAALDLTLGGWQRRSDDWLHQTQTLPIEIEQVELQILAAQRKRDQALLELNQQQRQVEHSAEVFDFLREKSSSEQLYLWMQRETLGLYHQMYELALHTTRQAERAFNLERGFKARKFIPRGAWNSLYDGLLAGDCLLVALRRMEKAYLDENVRAYELTKHISLRLMFPGDFLRLRTMGYCEISIPEWMYDLDYPGHYLRQIRNVTITLPFVTGPYSGVHCTLTLLSSTIRVDPSLRPPPHQCCQDRTRRNDYEPCADDPRIVRLYGARESIATSSGQNDAGLFELNFRDERYLPFEFFGAVCRLRIEIPPENNYFALDTLSDAVINISYTAKPGGPLLREAAREAAKGKLPGCGWVFFDIRRDFPDAWRLFERSEHRERSYERDEHCGDELILDLRRNLFPYLPGRPAIHVAEISLIVEPERLRGDCITVEAWMSDIHADRRRETREERDAWQIHCAVQTKWPEMYGGSAKAHIGVHDNRNDHRRLHLRLPESVGGLRNLFLFCRYEQEMHEEVGKDPCCRDPRHEPGWRPDIGASQERGRLRTPHYL